MPRPSPQGFRDSIKQINHPPTKTSQTQSSRSRARPLGFSPPKSSGVPTELLFRRLIGSYHSYPSAGSDKTNRVGFRADTPSVHLVASFLHTKRFAQFRATPADLLTSAPLATNRAPSPSATPLSRRHCCGSMI